LRYSNCHLVGRQDFLTLDGQFTLAHVNQKDLYPGPAIEAKIKIARNDIAAGFQDAQQFPVLVPEAAMRVLDDDFTFHGRPIRRTK
jgi:hypothetical protein